MHVAVELREKVPFWNVVKLFIIPALQVSRRIQGSATDGCPRKLSLSQPDIIVFLPLKKIWTGLRLNEREKFGSVRVIMFCQALKLKKTYCRTKQSQKLRQIKNVLVRTSNPFMIWSSCHELFTNEPIIYIWILDKSKKKRAAKTAWPIRTNIRLTNCIWNHGILLSSHQNWEIIRFVFSMSKIIRVCVWHFT